MPKVSNKIQCQQSGGMPIRASPKIQWLQFLLIKGLYICICSVTFNVVHCLQDVIPSPVMPSPVVLSLASFMGQFLFLNVQWKKCLCGLFRLYLQSTHLVVTLVLRDPLSDLMGFGR